MNIKVTNPHYLYDETLLPLKKKKKTLKSRPNKTKNEYKKVKYQATITSSSLVFTSTEL